MKFDIKPTLPAPVDQSTGWAYKSWVSDLSDGDLQKELQFHKNVRSAQHLQMGSLIAEIERRGLTIEVQQHPSSPPRMRM